MGQPFVSPAIRWAFAYESDGCYGADAEIVGIRKAFRTQSNGGGDGDTVYLKRLRS